MSAPAGTPFYFYPHISMPIYDYACQHCGKTFEEWLRSGDDAEQQPCPDCGKPAPRVLSNTSFILKGGGWFASSYGHGTSNLFDKSKGVPSIHDGATPEKNDTTKAEAPKTASSADTTPKKSGKEA